MVAALSAQWFSTPQSWRIVMPSGRAATTPSWHGPKSVANGSQHLRAGAEKPTWRTMFNDSSSLLAHLSTRRSGKARNLAHGSASCRERVGPSVLSTVVSVSLQKQTNLIDEPT